MAKTSYLVNLSPSAPPNIQTLALMACRSNNRKQSSKLTLSEFKEYFEDHYKYKPHYRCELSHNFLSIDANGPASSAWVNMLFIQEVDTFEAEEEEEDREDEDHGG